MQNRLFLMPINIVSRVLKNSICRAKTLLDTFWAIALHILLSSVSISVVRMREATQCYSRNFVSLLILRHTFNIVHRFFSFLVVHLVEPTCLLQSPLADSAESVLPNGGFLDAPSWEDCVELTKNIDMYFPF